MSKRCWVMSIDGRHLYDEAHAADTRLDVDGNWESDEQRIEYIRALMAKLNESPAKREAEIREEVRQAYEADRVYLQSQVNALTEKLDDARVVLTPREQAKDAAAMNLTAALTQMAVWERPEDDAEFLRREDVMELVTRWRTQWNAASASNVLTKGESPSRTCSSEATPDGAPSKGKPTARAESEHLLSKQEDAGIGTGQVRDGLASAPVVPLPEHEHTFCPHCLPCRKHEKLIAYEDAMWALASYVGNGPGSGEATTPADMEARIREGIDTITRAEKERASNERVQCGCLIESFHCPIHGAQLHGPDAEVVKESLRKDIARLAGSSENRRFESGSMAEVQVKTGAGFESPEVARGAKGPDGTSVKASAESGAGASIQNAEPVEDIPLRERAERMRRHILTKVVGRLCEPGTGRFAGWGCSLCGGEGKGPADGTRDLEAITHEPDCMCAPLESPAPKVLIAADGRNCPSNPGCGCLGQMGPGICRRADEESEEQKNGD